MCIRKYFLSSLSVLLDLTPDRRRIVANNYVRYENVTKTDAQVLQCNASNKHGYVFANAFLNVLGQFVCASLSQHEFSEKKHFWVEAQNLTF